MNVRPVKPRGVVPRRLEPGGLKADQRTKVAGMFGCDIENDPPTNRTPHQDRAIQVQRAHNGKDEFGIPGGRQPVIVALKPDWRQRFAVPRHVERDDPIILEHVRVGQKMPILPGIRTCGMQADERDALARFLEIDPVFHAADFNVRVATDDRFNLHHQLRASASPATAINSRGFATTSFTTWRLRISGVISPLMPQQPVLRQSKNVVAARRRHGLPQRHPVLGGGLERKRPLRHEQRPTLNRRHVAVALRQVELLRADFQHPAAIEPFRAPQEISIGVHETRNLFDEPFRARLCVRVHCALLRGSAVPETDLSGRRSHCAPGRRTP
jgi:hypothetical protein